MEPSDQTNQDAPSTSISKEMANEQVVTRDSRGYRCREGESQPLESQESKAPERLGKWVSIMTMLTVLDKLLSGKVSFDVGPVTNKCDAEVFDEMLISQQ